MSERAVESAARRQAATPTNGLCLRAETLTVSTRDRVELVNLTELVAEKVRASGVQNGLVLVNSLHTTVALFINEFQEALLADIRTFLERVVVRGEYYRHNDPSFSDCDRSNADAHLRAMLLGHNLVLPVHEGELLVGTFQAVILAELDGPRERALQVQILGV